MNEKDAFFLSTLNWMFFFKLQGTSDKKIPEKADLDLNVFIPWQFFVTVLGMVKK